MNTDFTPRLETGERQIWGSCDQFDGCFSEFEGPMACSKGEKQGTLRSVILLILCQQQYYP
jgi:hypothetical protein